MSKEQRSGQKIGSPESRPASETAAPPPTEKTPPGRRQAGAPPTSPHHAPALHSAHEASADLHRREHGALGATADVLATRTKNAKRWSARDAHMLEELVERGEQFGSRMGAKTSRQHSQSGAAERSRIQHATYFQGGGSEILQRISEVATAAGSAAARDSFSSEDSSGQDARRQALSVDSRRPAQDTKRGSKTPG